MIGLEFFEESLKSYIGRDVKIRRRRGNAWIDLAELPERILVRIMSELVRRGLYVLFTSTLRSLYSKGVASFSPAVARPASYPGVPEVRMRSTPKGLRQSKCHRRPNESRLVARRDSITLSG